MMLHYSKPLLVQTKSMEVLLTEKTSVAWSHKLFWWAVRKWCGGDNLREASLLVVVVPLLAIITTEEAARQLNEHCSLRLCFNCCNTNWDTMTGLVLFGFSQHIKADFSFTFFYFYSGDSIACCCCGLLLLCLCPWAINFLTLYGAELSATTITACSCFKWLLARL